MVFGHYLFLDIPMFDDFSIAHTEQVDDSPIIPINIDMTEGCGEATLSDKPVKLDVARLDALLRHLLDMPGVSIQSIAHPHPRVVLIVLRPGDV